MRWFRRSKGGDEDWAPPAEGRCGCSRHLDDELLETVVPFAPSSDMEEEPTTVGDLIDAEALAAEPVDEEERMLADGTGPYHWNLWLGDETRASYDDDAPLQLDAAIKQQDGVERAAWLDREVIYVGAPRLCTSGALAVAALGLLEPTVRETT